MADPVSYLHLLEQGKQIDYLLESPELSEEEKIEFLGVANSETDRLTRLVNDVLDLSKIESGSEVQYEPMDLRPAIEQTLRNYKQPQS